MPITRNEDVRALAHEIVRSGCDFVNDPQDPGGATNHGVTIHTMRRLGLDLNKDGAITSADVRCLTRAQAVEVFITHDFVGPRIAHLPKSLQESVFDMYVNAGSNAVKILQRLIRNFGFDCAVNGVIGPLTIAAAARAFDAVPDHMNDAYAIERRNYDFRLADKRPTSRKYARTWQGAKAAGSPALRSSWLQNIGSLKHNFSKGSQNGLDYQIFGMVFGTGGNLIRDTAEVFIENAEKGAAREAVMRSDTFAQFAIEFVVVQRGLFDRLMDALNRIPRPAMALGTLVCSSP